MSLLPWVLSSRCDCSREVGGKASCTPRACNSQQLLHQREHGQGPPWLLCMPVSAQTGCQLIYMQWLINIVAQFIYPMWKAEEWLLDFKKIRHKCWTVEGRDISAVLPDVSITVSNISVLPHPTGINPAAASWLLVRILPLFCMGSVVWGEKSTF